MTPAAGASGRGRLFAGTAGLWAGLRITQTIYISLSDQVLAPGTKRLQVSVLNPSTDRHVTHAELAGSSLYGQQLVLFHAAEDTAPREQDNTLRGFTGILETCIIQSQDSRRYQGLDAATCRRVPTRFLCRRLSNL